MQILWCWFGFWVGFKPIIQKFCRVSYLIYLALLLLLLFSVSLVNTVPILTKRPCLLTNVKFFNVKILPKDLRVSYSNDVLLPRYAGDHVTLLLTGPDQASVTAGMVLCDPAHPLPVTARFQAKIVVFNIEIPITKGTAGQCGKFK